MYHQKLELNDLLKKHLLPPVLSEQCSIPYLEHFYYQHYSIVVEIGPSYQ